MSPPTNYIIAAFMRDFQRSYPYGVSEKKFYNKIRTVMKKDPELSLGQAVTLVQATIGSYNNPH